MARALVLSGYGINCENETAHAFRLAGAVAETVHVNSIIWGERMLSEYDILAIPGGFSFGDDISAGKALANKLKHGMGKGLEEFIHGGKPVIGICNGFQVLAKLGLLPALGRSYGEQEITLAFNDSGRFEDRWVRLVAEKNSPCIWTRGMETFMLPVRHGEGKVVAKDQETMAEMEGRGLICLRYAGPNGEKNPGYPHNPNGSVGAVAGVCDEAGLVFGLMPHPEAFLYRTNHPHWTRNAALNGGQGRAIFLNAVRHVDGQ